MSRAAFMHGEGRMTKEHGSDNGAGLATSTRLATVEVDQRFAEPQPSARAGSMVQDVCGRTTFHVG